MRIDKKGTKTYSGYEGQFTQFDRELQIVKCLGECGLRIFLGDTGTSQRMANIRAAIIDMGFADRPMNPKKLGRLTFGAAYEKTFNEPLIPNLEVAA